MAKLNKRDRVVSRVVNTQFPKLICLRVTAVTQQYVLHTMYYYTFIGMNVKAACWHGQGVTLRRPLLIALIGMIVGGGSHCHFTKMNNNEKGTF